MGLQGWGTVLWRLLCFLIQSLDCHSQETLYLLCFLHGGIIFGPPVNDVFSRFIRYGPLSPFGRPSSRFPGILARDEGWIIREASGICLPVTGWSPEKGAPRSLWKQMRVWAAFEAAALYTTSINNTLAIDPSIRSFIQQTFTII